MNDHALSSGFLDALQRETFDYFVHEANPLNGLIADKTQAGSPASIAAVGFALSSYPVGVERGFMRRADAIARTLATLRFFQRQRSEHRRRRDRIQRFLLPLSRHGDRKAGLEMRAVDDRQRHPHCRHVDCRRVLLSRRRGRARNSSVGRRTLPPRGLELGAKRRRHSDPWLEARERFSPLPVAGLLRGDDSLSARP